jgi:hypothetical protein
LIISLQVFESLKAILIKPPIRDIFYPVIATTASIAKRQLPPPSRVTHAFHGS